MPVKKYTFKGPIQWAKVFEANREMRDYQGVEHIFGGLYKIDMILDKDQKKIVLSVVEFLRGKPEEDIAKYNANHPVPNADKYDGEGGASAETSIEDLESSESVDGE